MAKSLVSIVELFWRFIFVGWQKVIRRDLSYIYLQITAREKLEQEIEPIECFQSQLTI